MNNDYAISVEHVSKMYSIYARPIDRLKEALHPGNRKYHHEFYALRDISFNVRRGGAFGIIGNNGSGKSTLLKILAGVLTPTSGLVKVNGRVCALLELGAGFNPEFTGLQNVFLQGTLMGFSRLEMQALLPSIAAFADIGEFLNQPVKVYSSGMYVRLAFAIIAHVPADIMIIDEALSVGDIFFVQKCMRFIRQFQENGGTILFVSHDLATVNSICHSVALLVPGGEKSAVIGSAKEMCKFYTSQLYKDPIRNSQVAQQRLRNSSLFEHRGTEKSKTITWDLPETNVYSVSPFRTDAEDFGQGGAVILDAGFFSGNHERLLSVTGGQTTCFIVRALAKQRIVFPAIGIMIKDIRGQYLNTQGTDTVFRRHEIVLEKGQRLDVVFTFIMPILACGTYTINVAIAEGRGADHVQHHWIHDALKLEAISSPVDNGIGGLLTSEITMEFIDIERECSQ